MTRIPTDFRMTEWIPVILPAFFGVVSILSAVWPGHVMRITRAVCQWLLQLLGLEGTLRISDQAAGRCRIFNLCMILFNGVMLWVGLHAQRSP